MSQDDLISITGKTVTQWYSLYILSFVYKVNLTNLMYSKNKHNLKIWSCADISIISIHTLQTQSIIHNYQYNNLQIAYVASQVVNIY